MATLEKIRSRAVLLIAIVGLALLAFIIGDFLKSESTFAGNAQRVVAEIGGDKVMIDQFQNKVNEMTEVYKLNMNKSNLDEETNNTIHDQTWDELVREHVMGKEYNSVGLSVSEDELFDLIQGKNIDPIIRQMFANPQTGQFDKNIVINYIKSLDQDESGVRKIHWLFYERMITENRLNAKYLALITKGLGITSSEAKIMMDGAKESKAIEFVSKPYTSIPDNQVKISDSEIKSYYESHKDLYKQEPNRSINFVVFDVKPTQDDFDAVKKWSEKVAKEVTSITDENELRGYLKLNSDAPWDEKYIAPENLEANLKSFGESAAVGSVFGPYEENETFKIVKITNRAMLPDSVKASHILVKENTPERTKVVADSLMLVIKKTPSLFPILAKRYSKDSGSSDKGGELGWFGEGLMVKPFNDACFKGKTGDILEVKTQYGTHIINIEEQSKASLKVQLARIIRKVTPSTETSRQVYALASKFIGQNNTADKFKSGASQFKITVRSAPNIHKNDRQILDISQARQIVRWVFKAEIGEISSIFEMENQYVIAVLTQINEEKYQTLSQASAAVRASLIQDKKAEMIMKEFGTISGTSTLSAVAQKQNLTIQNADGVNFNSYFVQGAGVEPALVGAVSAAKENVVTGPIKGESGVFVFKVVSQQASPQNFTVPMIKQQYSNSLQYRLGYQVFDALKQEANIVDNRIRFY